MSILDEPNVSNLTREELLHYAAIEGNDLTRRIVELLEQRDFQVNSELELEADEARRALDDLIYEYDALEAVADEAQEKITNYIGELEDLLQVDEDQLRTSLMAYIDKLAG